MATEELWHLVEARRDDGVTAMFRIRELAPRQDQPNIFVVELPYPVTALSRLPDATAYRRLSAFEEQWLGPAANALGWTFVAAKTEDGSFFLYLYGSGEPNAMIERLSPFDGALGFFDEQDPAWDEYAALKELLDEANAMPSAWVVDDEQAPAPVQARKRKPGKAEANLHTKTTTRIATKAKSKSKAKPAAKPKAKAAAKPKAKKPAAKPKAKKPAAKPKRR